MARVVARIVDCALEALAACTHDGVCDGCGGLRRRIASQHDGRIDAHACRRDFEDHSLGLGESSEQRHRERLVVEGAHVPGQDESRDHSGQRRRRWCCCATARRKRDALTRLAADGDDAGR